MRKSVRIVAALVALAAAIGGFGVARHYGRPSMPPTVGAATAPTASVVIAPPAPAQPEPPPQVAATAPAAPDADLPSVEIATLIPHPVPADSAAEVAPHVTVEQRNGRILQSAPQASPPPRPTPVAADPATIDGTARPIAGPIISVAGRTVRLFGVRAADARERCTPGSGGGASCAEAARAALAARLGGNPSVNCTMPPGQRGDPGFICRDAAGVDLGGMLVAQGLALVDRSNSYQYVGAEDAARASHQGLWRYR